MTEKMKINRPYIYFRFMVLVLAGILFSSCVPRERIVYFQGDLESMERRAGEYSARIQPDDLLSITIFARNQEATRIFNQEANLGMSSSSTGNRPTYLVDQEGYIEFPVLGKIKLSGMTRNEAIHYMKGLLSDEIIDPGVSITINNYRITVLGEVSNPGTFSMEHEKVSIL